MGLFETHAETAKTRCRSPSHTQTLTQLWAIFQLGGGVLKEYWVEPERSFQGQGLVNLLASPPFGKFCTFLK